MSTFSRFLKGFASWVHRLTTQNIHLHLLFPLKICCLTKIRLSQRRSNSFRPHQPRETGATFPSVCQIPLSPKVFQALNKRRRPLILESLCLPSGFKHKGYKVSDNKAATQSMTIHRPQQWAEAGTAPSPTTDGCVYLCIPAKDILYNMPRALLWPEVPCQDEWQPPIGFNRRAQPHHLARLLSILPSA